MTASIESRVLAFIGGHPAAMAALNDPTAGLLLHVTQHTADGEVRLDGCPCARGITGLPVDELGRAVLEQLGDGQYISSARHTLADLIRDVTGE